MCYLFYYLFVVVIIAKERELNGLVLDYLELYYLPTDRLPRWISPIPGVYSVGRIKGVVPPPLPPKK